MVQSQELFLWSKYYRCLFPFDLPGMIAEMNNLHELFCQNITEFLQTDIDWSLHFLLNLITIKSLEKYLKTCYMPPLDIELISSIWDQLLTKKMDTFTDDVWELQSLQQLFPLQYSHQHFISVSRNKDTLNQLWNCYSSFIFKRNQLHKIINNFLVIYQSSVSGVFIVEKVLLRLKCLGTFYSLHPWLILIT
jgi:hypothetical protein